MTFVTGGVPHSGPQHSSLQALALPAAADPCRRLRSRTRQHWPLFTISSLGPPSQGSPDWEPSELIDDPGGTSSPSHGWSVQDALVSMIFSSPSAEPSRVELGASLGLPAVPAEAGRWRSEAEPLGSSGAWGAGGTAGEYLRVTGLLGCLVTDAVL